MVYFWLAMIIFLGILEIVTVNLVSVWFVISGLISLILSCFIDEFVIQFAVFVLLGVLLMFSTRSTLEKMLVRKEKTNLDRIIGMKGVVTEEIDELQVGEVKVDGKKWSATSTTKLVEGEMVKILKINGVKVEVERWEE